MFTSTTIRSIKLPIIRSGDDLLKIIMYSLYESILETKQSLKNKDVIGITESIVARAQGNYVTVDDIAAEVDRLFGKNATIVLDSPIYSRNRFSMILKGIARSAKTIYLIMPDFDEVGNPNHINMWTGVDIEKYYREICESENCECFINASVIPADTVDIDCSLRPTHTPNLKSFFTDKCKWGLLGSNKANEETLKLFPNTELAQDLVEKVKAKIKAVYDVDVEVMVYGDGAFKDPVSGI